MSTRIRPSFQLLERGLDLNHCLSTSEGRNRSAFRPLLEVAGELQAAAIFSASAFVAVTFGPETVQSETRTHAQASRNLSVELRGLFSELSAL